MLEGFGVELPVLFNQDSRPFGMFFGNEGVLVVDSQLIKVAVVIEEFRDLFGKFSIAHSGLVFLVHFQVRVGIFAGGGRGLDIPLLQLREKKDAAIDGTVLIYAGGVRAHGDWRIEDGEEVFDRLAIGGIRAWHLLLRTGWATN